MQDRSKTDLLSVSVNPESILALDAIHKKPDAGDLLSKVYSAWSAWGPCSDFCQQSRKRLCKKDSQCGKSYIKEKRKCKSKKSCSKRSKRKYIKLLGLRKSDKLVTEILYNILYSSWTPWSACNRSCKKLRKRKCIQSTMCGKSYIQEERMCKRTSLICRKQYILRTFALQSDQKNDMDENVNYIKNITQSVMGNSTNQSLGPKGRFVDFLCSILDPVFFFGEMRSHLLKSFLDPVLLNYPVYSQRKLD